MRTNHIDSTLIAIAPGPESEWSSDNWSVADDAGRTATVWGEPDDPETEGNAQRIVACWNACHGLDLPPDIAPGTVASLVAAARIGLDYLQRTNPLEHGNPDLGRTWGALEDALAPFNP